jgi:Transcriptional regulators of sugar metabolism
MLAIERTQYIMKTLQDNKVISVNELSKVIQVTEETIRRDLEKLEKQGLISRVHGGAYLREGFGNETPTEVRGKIYQKEKEKIAKMTLAYINDFESVLLDCSTTANYIAKEIKASGKKISVVTNSMLVAKELEEAEQVRLILLGGEYRNNTKSFCGAITVEALDHYYVDKVFISSAGLCAEAGITDYTLEEATIRTKMIKQAKSCFYVADITKIGRKAIYRIGDIEDVDYLIVNESIDKQSKELKDALLLHNKKIVVND